MSTALYRPYVTLDDVKFYCGISLDKIDYDEDIKKAINKASRYIDGLTERFYYKKAYADAYLSTGYQYEGWEILDDKLFTPPNAPIIDVTTLIIGSVTLVENTDFYIDKKAGMIERAGGNWPISPRQIIITCNLGYDSSGDTVPSADIPGDIAQYCLEISSRFSGHFKKSIKNYVSGASEEIDLFGVPKEIVNELKALRPVKMA